MERNFYFNDNNLNAVNNFAINGINYFNEDTRRVIGGTYIGSDGGVNTESYLSPRLIVVTGYFGSGTRQQLEADYKSLNALLAGVNKKIEFDINGALKRFYGNVKMVQPDEPVGGFMRITIVFEAPEPFYYDIAESSESTSNETTNGFTLAVTNNGNYETPFIATLTLDSFTGDSDRTITLSLNDNAINITTSIFAATDIIVYNGLLNTVTLNDESISFIGGFSLLQPGDNTFTYSDTFSARQVDLSVNFTQRYI